MAPEDDLGGGLPNTEGADNILDFLNAGDKDEAPARVVNKDKDKDNKDDKDDDEVVLVEEGEEEPNPDEEEQEGDENKDEEEIEEEEETPDIKDDDVILASPKRKEILKKYPNLFKDFPTIEGAIYREQQFSELFPTIADAKQAAQDIGALRSFEQDLMTGSIESTLLAVKEQDSKAFANLVSPENLLSNLQKVDNEAFLNTIGFSVRSVLKNAFDRAGKIENQDDRENMELAIKYVNKFVFGENEVKGPVSRAKEEVDPKKSEYEAKIQKINEDNYKGALTSITESVDKQLRGILERSIDPKNMMSSYVKDKAIDDAMNLARKEVQSDQRFRAILTRQWQAAGKANYSPDSLNVIKKSIIAQNKSAFQSAIRRVRAEALKDNARRSNGANRSRDDRPVERGRPAASNKDKSSTKPMERGERTVDYLMRD